jgi:hypothetical protein
LHTHQKITLDINQNASFVYINAKQGDKSTRYVDAIITCDGVQYKPPVGAIAYFRCEKSDGTGCSYPATINTDGSVTAELTNKALSAPGDVVADISIEGMHGEVLSTASFTIRVEEIPLGDNIESSNEYVRLIALTNRANEIVSELENATFRTFQGYIQATTDGENWVDLVEINTLVGSQGPAGKSAYEYAQDGGYTGTEEEFAEKLAHGTTGVATPAFYVTVQPNNVGSGYEADKTIGEIDEAYKSGKPVFCNFISDSVGSGTLLLMTWPTTPVIVYSFRGVVDSKEVTVNITENHVGAIIDDLAIKDDTSAFYVGVQFDGESGGYVADKTVDDIGAAYQEGKPVFCKFIGETSFRMTLLLMAESNYMCSFAGADSVRAATVNITQTGVGVVVKEIPDSGIPIPETAEVGQTIVVKAVDENGKPTAWEAADFPEGGSGGEAFALIASGELTEETTAITITTDNNGNPFKLRRGQFMLQLMGTTTNTTDNGALRIRHNYNTAAKGSTIELIARIRNKASWTSLFGIYEFFPDIPSSSIYYLPPSTASGHVGFAEYDSDWNDSPYLSALYLSGITENAKTMGVGTKWELWGVRA